MYKYILLTIYVISQAFSKLEKKDDDEPHHIRCGGKSVKTNNLCAYMARETIVDGKLSDTNFLYVYSKCEDYEKCVANEENNDRFDYKCAAQPVKREHGESCEYNRDCLSSKCNDKKICEPIKNGYNCDEFRDNQCLPGSYCGLDGNRFACKEMASEGQKCSSTNECRLGLSCFNGNCTKWGSLPLGRNIGKNDDPELCESGMAYNESGIIQCAEVVEEGKCPQSNDGYVGLKLNRDSYTFPYKCVGHHGVDGKRNYIPPYMKYVTTAFKEFMKDYNKIQPYSKDFYKGEKYVGERGGFGKYSTRIKYLKYKYALDLIGRKMMDNTGKIINSCEFEFYIKHLSSGFAKYNIIISILLLLGLLL